MNITKFLDPKNNFAFTQIFGTEKNKDILIHFLNDVLKYKEDEQITEVCFLKTIQDAEIAVYRQSIVDVLCTNQNNEQFIVEMQLSHHKGFEKRAQYYAAKAYSQQILKEDENHKKMAVYAKLKGVIFLAIADFVMFPEKEGVWKSEHRILDEKTYENDLKDFYFVFIELAKFNKSLKESITLEEKWCYFLKHADESSLAEIESLIGKDPIIKRAFEAIDQASWTEEELRTYERITKANLDNLAVEQQKIEDAEARGEARGKAERNIEIALNLLKQGLSDSLISSATDLSIDKILKIKNRM
jgi:predicted transposase/invertase (TIGR01784 family)